MTGQASIEELLSSSEFGHDPYPAYRRLLAVDGPVWSEARKAWLIARYDHVVGALRDWRHFSSEGRIGAMLDHFSEDEWRRLDGLRQWRSMKGIIHADPPDHARFRGLFARAFSTRGVEQLRSTVHQLVDELLDRVGRGAQMDVVADLALPLPAAVISRVLGVPDEDRAHFVAWSDAALGLQGSGRPSLEVAIEASNAYTALLDYFAALIDGRQRHPGGEGDFVTGLLRARDADPELSNTDLVQSCITLLMGGYETTTSLIANTVLLLLQRPSLVEAVRADPALLAPVVEESLRFECPIQTLTRRIGEDVRVGDAVLAKDDLAILMMGAANRDPLQFEDPDTFDVERAERHVAFGFGIHLCVGATLARLEAPIAVSGLLRRFPKLALVDERIAWNAGKPVVRCPSTLPVAT